MKVTNNGPVDVWISTVKNENPKDGLRIPPGASWEVDQRQIIFDPHVQIGEPILKEWERK